MQCPHCVEPVNRLIVVGQPLTRSFSDSSATAIKLSLGRAFATGPLYSRLESRRVSCTDPPDPSEDAGGIVAGSPAPVVSIRMLNAEEGIKVRHQVARGEGGGREAREKQRAEEARGS